MNGFRIEPTFYPPAPPPPEHLRKRVPPRPRDHAPDDEEIRAERGR